MNLRNFEDTKGFILDTPKDMKLDFFGVDFWHLLCLSSIETFFFFFFAPLRIDRHSPSFPLFFFYITFLKVFLDGPQSMAFLVLPFKRWTFVLSLLLSFLICP